MNQQHLQKASIESLYKLAENISKLKQSEESDYKPTSFFTITLPSPYIMGNLNIPILYYRTIVTKEKSVINETVVQCRKLENVFDLDSREIFQTKEGLLFSYVYDFSRGIETAYFTIPRLSFVESKGISEVFQRAAENLVTNTVQTSDEMFKLALMNRITQLQEIAYAQGRGSNLLKS